MCKMLKKSLSVFSCVVSMCFALFLITPVKAEAALSGGRFMTTQECLDTFGSSFSVSYWNGSDIVETTALYQSTATFGTVAAVAQTDYMQPGRSCLLYTFQGSVSSSPEQIQIDISPQYSLFDIDQLHTCILTPANATYTSPYQSPQWIWMLGGQRTVFEGLSSSSGEMYRTYVGNRLCIYCPVDWSSGSLTSGYSVRATFCSGSLVPVDGVYCIYIGVPYVTSSAEGSNGTIVTSGSSISGTGVNVNVDMRETNGLLSSIQNTLSGIGQSILNGISAIFVPDPDYIQSKVNAIYDKFSWWRSIVTTWNSFYDSFSALDFDSPPQYTIDYSETTSAYGYSYGASARVLVLDWFLEYRDTVRIFLRGFIWLFFIWRVYCHIPNIIQGSGMDVQRTDDGSVSVAPRGKH